MKKLFLIITFASTMLSAEEFTIQTISAKKTSSITPSFEKKVHDTALAVEKRKEGSCNIVTVGKYDNFSTAKHDLNKAKTVAKDAFVRPVTRVTPSKCTGEEAASHKVVATNEPKENKTLKKEEPSVVKAESKNLTPLVASTAEPKVLQHVSAVEPKSIQNTSTPCDQKPCVSPPPLTNVYVYDRNLRHKSDISEALAYYKNSPYYSFRPIGLPH